MSKTSIVIKIILLAFCSVLPILLFIFLKSNIGFVQEEAFQTKYGSLYQNFRRKTLPELLFNVPFLLRRLIYAYAIGFIA
jgi:hypothetical protein